MTVITAIIEWVKTLQGIDWVLVGLIFLIVVVYIFLLVRITQTQYIGKFIGKWKIRIFGILLGLTVGFYILYNLHNIQSNQWIEILMMAGLVAVTGALAVYAAGQAYASMKMAEEMRAQRVASKPVVIPDIDLQSGQRYFKEKMKDIAQSNFPVVLTNVGTTAAIELELLLKTPRNDSLSQKLPLLLQGGSWRSELRYLYFTDGGEPMFDKPPPEGLYELKVSFRPATSRPNTEFSEVTLPFDLHRGWGDIWRIERHELHQEIKE